MPHAAWRLQEIDELFKIFRVLGTPDESTWPGVSRYPDYKDTFPKWPARSLAELVPTLEPAGIEVLSLMLRYVYSSHAARAAADDPGGT